MKHNVKLKEVIKAQAIIFDMDGVITDTMPYHFRAWQRVFQLQGIDLTREEIYLREGQRGIESLEEIFHKHGKMWNLRIARKTLKDKEVLFKKIFKLKFIPGSKSLLKQCYKDSFKLALVTGTSRHEAKRLLPKEIFEMFQVTVCGCDVQNGKPHPEPYLRALQELGVGAKEALVVENAPYGIQSAKAAGLRCVAIATSLPVKHLKQADYIFPSMMHLKRMMRFSYDKSI